MTMRFLSNALRVCVFLAALPVLLLSAKITWSKPPIATPADTPVVGEADALLLRKLYNEDDAEAGLKSLQRDEEFLALVKKHDLRLFSGPMLGRVTDQSASIWLRTATAAKVEVRLTGGGQSDQKTTSTSEADDFTTIVTFSGLQSNTEYSYDVLIDGRSAIGVLGSDRPTFRTAPQKGDRVKFSVAFGGGARYVPEKERIWDTIAKRNPQGFLFLGDNIYIDEPQWRNKQRVMYYRRQMRPEFRRLTASTACYAIWDDHDFGKNDVAGGLATFEPNWKLPVWKVFRENWNNAAYGGGPRQPGCWFDFQIGDVHFFMTDGRYYRSFKDGTMLGPAQKRWLKAALQNSTATFKVIASGTLWTEHADKGGKDSWWGAKAEREELFSHLEANEIGGVILISADRHRTDIYRIERPNSYDLYEFETSKLTNNHTHPTRKQAVFSYNKGNFYGLLEFDFSESAIIDGKLDPVMTFRCIDIDGKQIHAMPLRRSQLEKK